ncbi:MAG: hypothetical protein ACK5IC_05395 [Moheibacter sp.]
MKNKALVTLLCLGVFGIINGAILKIGGNENAVITIAVGLVLKFGAIIGLVVKNFSKLKYLVR